MIAYIPGGIILSRLPDPRTIRHQAMAAPNADGKKEAMEKEMGNLMSHHVYELVPRAPAMRTLRLGWVLHHKFKDGVSEKNKARVVARGNHQRPGIDYNERCSHSHPSCALNPSTCFDLARAAILTWTVIPKRRHYHSDQAHDRIAAGIDLQARYAIAE